MTAEQQTGGRGAAISHFANSSVLARLRESSYGASPSLGRVEPQRGEGQPSVAVPNTHLTPTPPRRISVRSRVGGVGY
jgi:hypothetical protein